MRSLSPQTPNSEKSLAVLPVNIVQIGRCQFPLGYQFSRGLKPCAFVSSTFRLNPRDWSCNFRFWGNYQSALQLLRRDCDANCLFHQHAAYLSKPVRRYSRRGQEIVIVLYALRELGAIRSKQEVLGFIHEHRFSDLRPEDKCSYEGKHEWKAENPPLLVPEGCGDRRLIVWSPMKEIRGS